MIETREMTALERLKVYCAVRGSVTVSVTIFVRCDFVLRLVIA